MNKKIFNFVFLFTSVFVFGSLSTNSVFAESINITQINFTSLPKTIDINIASAVLITQTQNAENASEPVSETTTLNYASTSETGQFSDANISEGTCNESTWSENLTLTLASTRANKGFCYRDSTAGTYTLTISAEGTSWAPATQEIVIVGEEITDPEPEPEPEPDPVTITLKIYAGGTVLFDEPKTVTACAESPETDAPITLNAKCAVEQSGLSNTWTWYDSNFSTNSSLPKTIGLLDELGGNASDFVNFFFWGWFSDLNYGTVALNNHPLHANEELLLTYNSFPLRISASKNSGVIGDQITFTAEEKSTFSADFSDMVWTPSLEATITLGTQSCTTITNGTCSIVLDTVGSLDAIGSKTLYVPSASLDIEVTAAPTGGGNTGGGGTNPPATFNTANAINYLESAQGSDGSFGDSPLYTDWTAIAYGAENVTGSSRDSLLGYLNSHNKISSLLTDNERRAMALLALNQNPYSFSGINYIKAITDSFDGTQLGDIHLDNDDIFGLIVLPEVGYKINDVIISKTISFILSAQTSNGSWDNSVDMSGAAIQALKSFESINGVSEALSKATDYLVSKQNNNGGWENSVFSTSWVMQAENALGESWKKNGKSGLDYLAAQQVADGAASPSSETLANRIWATSYAIAAASGNSWSEIMQNVSKPANQNNSQNDSNNSPADISENTNPQTPTNPVICPSGDLFSATTGEACTGTTPPVVCPLGDLFSATTGEACTVTISDSVSSPQTSRDNTTLEPASNTVLSNNGINNKSSDQTSVSSQTEETKDSSTSETNENAEIIPDTLTATAVNALPTRNIPENLPIILGTISGIVLLYLVFKFLII